MHNKYRIAYYLNKYKKTPTTVHQQSAEHPTSVETLPKTNTSRKLNPSNYNTFSCELINLKKQ